MKQIIFLLFLSVFSNVIISKEIDCEIIVEAATSITLEEFYFGHHIEVLNISNGPTISLWGANQENRNPNKILSTNYLISVGYGDIAEKPLVYRINSSKQLGFKGGLAKSVIFDGKSLKIELTNENNGLTCNHFILDMKQE